MTETPLEARLREPRKRPYHRASLINPDGGVSALCFKVPRAIDLKTANWTIRDEAVTCPRCRRAIRARAALPREEG